MSGPPLGLTVGSERAKGFGQQLEPETIGRYVVLDTLGKGGMGIVLQALDRELNRPVALKVLHEHLGDHHTSRLRREAQALAALSHPNVVQVYEVGQVEGRTFVAMELVKGQTPLEWVEQDQPDWRACVKMFIQLGEGLATAHAKGLVHRDFKPGNAIIDQEGRARVLDFGLARRGDEGGHEAPPCAIPSGPIDPQDVVSPEQSLTKTGTILGTPAYMPPEQMNGKEADARSDQFSFCVSLYEVLYGERPYAGDSFLARMAAVVSGQVRPAPRGSLVPAELRRIVLRGLAADPSKRWPSMDALLEQLRRLVAPSRGWRWVTGVGALAMITAVIAVRQTQTVGDQEAVITKQGEQITETKEELAKQVKELRNKDQRLTAELAIQKGQQAQILAEDAGRELDAVRLAVETFEDLGDEVDDVPAAVFGGLTHALAGIHRGIALRGHAARVLAVEVSADGQRIATASEDNTVRLWNARSGAPLQTLEGHEDEVRSVAFSPGGAVLASAGDDQTIRLWDVVTGRPLEWLGPLRHPQPVLGVAFSPDGTRLASASGNEAWVWTLDDDAWVVPLWGHTGRVRSVAWSPDGARLYTASEDRTVRIWDVQAGHSLHVLEGHTDAVFDVAVCADGTRMATGGRDETVRVWNTQTGEPLATLEPGEVVRGVAFSPDGKKLATGTFDDGVARVWEVATGHPVTEVRHEDAVVDVAFSPSGDQLVTASWDGTARSWDVEPSRVLMTLPHSRRVDAVAFSPDGSRLATASGDGSVRLWDARSGAPVARLEGHRIDVLDVRYSPDGSSLATASWDGSVRLWDAVSNTHRTTLRGHTEPVRAVAWSPDGRTVVTASRDGTARVWDAATGAEEHSISHGAPLVDASFSPDGERLITVGADDRARVWSIATGEVVSDHPHEGAMTAVAFSPDGSRLAVAAKDGSVSIRDAGSDQGLALLVGHTAPVRALVFSPDGTQLATASDDQTARLWRTKRRMKRRTKRRTKPGEPMEWLPLTVFPHEDPVASVTFSPEGTQLATASGDEVARVWALEPERWLAWGCGVLNRRHGHTESSAQTCSRWSSVPAPSPPPSPRLAEPVEPAVMLASDLDELEVITVHGVELVRIPGGTFTMGSPPGDWRRDAIEEPPQEVTLDSFYLARTEVTYAQYALYLEANPEAQPPRLWDDERYNQPDQPITGLDWFDVQAYCDWAGLVLPTEAQWEYAARAGATTSYWFADEPADLGRFGWFFDNSGAKERGYGQARVHSVAKKGMNAWGLFDVHGNVWEWTLDAFEPYTTPVRPGDGLRKKPVGRADRVNRGGSWFHPARYARVAARDWDSPSYDSHTLGFRPARAIH